MLQVTYGQMDRVLSSLGFSVRVVNNDKKLRLYEHKEAGARLPLAYHPDEDIVLPHHFAAVQGTLQVHGIADPLDFIVQLQKPG